MGSEAEAKANKQSEAEHKRENPSAQWKEIVRGAWHDFSPSYGWNLLFLIVGLLITPGIGLLMNKPQIIIAGVALGLTILIWTPAIFLIKHAGQLAPVVAGVESATPATQKTVMRGVLTPASTDHPGTGSITVYIGNSTVVSYDPSFSLIKMGKDETLRFETTAAGLLINAVIRNPAGDIAGRIVNNVFHLDSTAEYEVRNPDAHTIYVLDENDNTMLFVHYLNPSTVKVLGRFYYKGLSPIIINEEKQVVGGLTYSETIFSLAQLHPAAPAPTVRHRPKPPTRKAKD